MICAIYTSFSKLPSQFLIHYILYEDQVALCEVVTATSVWMGDC